MDYSNTSDTRPAATAGIIDRVRETATAGLSTQKDRASEGLTKVVEVVRLGAAPLRDHQHEAIAGYVEKAADGLERFSARLRERDISAVLGDVQRFARSQPALFVGAAFAAGLLGARFLKSSAGNGLASSMRSSAAASGPTWTRVTAPPSPANRGAL